MNARIKHLKRQIEIEEEKEDGRRKRRTFLCCCGKMHQIGRCDAVQTHYYIRPHGCTGGDYWLPGEIQITCPKTGVVNRILFKSKYDVPWDKRDHYDFSAEIQFRKHYSKAFKSMAEVFNEHHLDGQKWKNNFYIDKHHKKFGIKIAEVGKEGK